MSYGFWLAILNPLNNPWLMDFMDSKSKKSRIHPDPLNVDIKSMKFIKINVWESLIYTNIYSNSCSNY